jgi:hypothetical protein
VLEKLFIHPEKLWGHNLICKSDIIGFLFLYSLELIFKHNLAKLSMNSSFIETVGTRTYEATPLSLAIFLYSISSSTNVSACSETKETGTKIRDIPSFPA